MISFVINISRLRSWFTHWIIRMPVLPPPERVISKGCSSQMSHRWSPEPDWLWSVCNRHSLSGTIELHVLHRRHPCQEESIPQAIDKCQSIRKSMPPCPRPFWPSHQQGWLFSEYIFSPAYHLLIIKPYMFTAILGGSGYFCDIPLYHYCLYAWVRPGITDVVFAALLFTLKVDNRGVHIPSFHLCTYFL